MKKLKLLHSSYYLRSLVKHTKFNFCNKILKSSKKDSLFTISLIGRPNVGKSTLFNKLSGQSLSLVDSTPGLTRDRKESILKLFGVKIRIVDTAGIDDFEENKDYNDLLNKSIYQTRQALIYSDLAFFLLDAKEGVTYDDIKLANWLNKLKNKTNITTIESNLNSELPSEEFYEKLRNLKEEEDIKIPKIVLLANKTENNFVPSEVFSEFAKLDLGDPILISAEHGDNLHDVYQAIEENIPQQCKEKYQVKIKKRMSRYNEYKEKFKNDFIENISKLPINEQQKYSLETWEKDFDYLNKYDLEDNSDYDSDNDINPMDTLTEVPKNMITNNIDIKNSAKTKNKINSFKQIKRPIKIAVVGKENVGKSSIINSLLKENRVIISDIPGTTRDSIPVEWIYKGRRFILIDTAGLKPKNKVHEKIDKMVSASTIKSIKYCHVVIYVIDAMEAFSPMDMKLIEYIGEQGRSLVIVANKWDLVENGWKTKAKKWIEEQLERGCSEYKLQKINYVSAKNFYKIDSIMDDVLNGYTAWNSHIETYLLNQWLGQIKKISNSPSKEGEYLKLKFMTQIKTRPPAFTVFVNNIKIFHKFHEAYLKKMMVKEFNLKFSPIRFLLRDHKKITQMNPYKKVSVSTAKIQKKVELMKNKMANPTYRRKSKGYDKLYGKKSIYRQMKK